MTGAGRRLAVPVLVALLTSTAFVAVVGVLSADGGAGRAVLVVVALGLFVLAQSRLLGALATFLGWLLTMGPGILLVRTGLSGEGLDALVPLTTAVYGVGTSAVCALVAALLARGRRPHDEP